MAPSYASLFCGYLEKDIVFNEVHNPHLHQILHWKRYIDDIFFIWNGTQEQLGQFHQFLNNCNKHLKFTIESDPNKMNFLDVLVYKEDNKLYSNLYRKNTDRNSILHGRSFHPVPLKKSLPISQFKRIRRICSTDSDYQFQAEEMEKRFQQREYKQQWIIGARKKFEQTSQSECLQCTNKKTADLRLNCMVQYSPVSRELGHIIQKHWHIIQTDPDLKTVFSLPPRIVHKRPPNLNSMLVRANLPPKTEPHFLKTVPHGNYRCGRCTQCNFTQKTQTFNHPRTGKTFKISGVITCNTNNVIYMLKCPCGLAYIGKTTRPLKTRISEHRSNIRNHDKKSPVAIHFTQAQHNVSALRYLGIEQVKLTSRGGDINSLLLKREAYWIYTLETLNPKGLNEDFDLRPFL